MRDKITSIFIGVIVGLLLLFGYKAIFVDNKVSDGINNKERGTKITNSDISDEQKAQFQERRGVQN